MNEFRCEAAGRASWNAAKRTRGGNKNTHGEYTQDSNRKTQSRSCLIEKKIDRLNAARTHESKIKTQIKNQQELFRTANFSIIKVDVPKIEFWAERK